MKNLFIITVIAFCFLQIACSPQGEKKEATKVEAYTIKGKITGLEDGTQIVLVDLDTQTKLDTCLIQDGKVYFEGEAETPIYAILRMYKKDSEGFDGFLGVSKTFYLDNSNFTLDTDTTDLPNAYFGGSKENDMVNELDKSIQVYRLKMETISTAGYNPDVTEEGQKRLEEEYELAWKEMQVKEKEFILSHPDIYPAFHMLNKHVQAYASYQKYLAISGPIKPIEPIFTKEELETAYNNTIEKYKNTDLGKSIYTTLFEKKATVGEAYIEFVDTYTLDGKPFKVSDIKTEYVLLDFTGVHCGWCKKFNKEMMPHYDKVKDKLTIVAFYTDTDKEKIKNSVEKDGLPWLIVSDFKGDKSLNKKHYEISGIPDFFFLDKGRNIVKHVMGYDEEFIKELSELK